MHEHSTTWQVVTVGLTYVHGGVGCMHEQHKGRGGDGCSLLQATLAIQVYVNVKEASRCCFAHWRQDCSVKPISWAKMGTISAPPSARKKRKVYAFQRT